MSIVSQKTIIEDTFKPNEKFNKVGAKKQASNITKQGIYQYDTKALNFRTAKPNNRDINPNLTQNSTSLKNQNY